ncbi:MULTISPECIES: NAD(P)H-dependent oxidoreductase [Loigolactobacillus]|uniref:Urocanate reductase n=1 Tax=Loigolactobacillus backii TaxID=375175 RepID=A0A192H0Y5_9LACO|nr:MULTISPECIES: NAD(P)H-dependent oxidoreductase [Loigolactobacillus]ANK61943.1 fumarate reductase [Loigolactobacillus backii]ANK68863.1 fumarate reductase [Loigolactobacillus backii]MDA5386861.1 FAD-binding protein [Loigolactobacillus backii]MDA5389354.1 FAD-binding protein [Loigolactobacillus backii]
MKLVGIVGTNADFSYNRFLLQFMKRHFASRATIDLLEIQDIPLFNENNSDCIPAVVTEFSQKVAQADGVIIATPEYDHAIPAALKSLIEWLSCADHPFAHKPVMIVGASYGPQGTSRAQMNLRQILDSPGVDASVLPGNEFLLNYCKDAFDERHNLKAAQTISFLEQCFANYIDYVKKLNPTVKEGVDNMAYTDQINWSATYDTLVLGFGGAGATAARFAADNDAKVLLVDAAPAGKEGGNTRYSAQLIGTGDNFEDAKAYYKILTAPMALPEDMIDVYVDGMVHMRDYVKKYLNVEPFSFKNEFDLSQTNIPIKDAIFEYPEYKGVEAYDFTTVHAGMFDAALWKILRQKVLDRTDKIDVWLNSRATHLIQDPETKVILGATIKRAGKLYNIRAKNGVVLTVGGFENNKQQIQNYLGAEHLAPLGSLYNRGDGLNMAAEVGAKMWHMNNYEALGMLHGMAFDVPEGQRARLIIDQWPDLYTGSIITVADDGSRYFKEDETNRHGHIYDHGTWRIPRTNVHPYLIFDQSQLDQFKQNKKIPYAAFLENLVKADSLNELANKIEANPEKLQQTVTDFNEFAKNGRDYAYNRDPKTLRAFDAGPFYAAALTHDVLNTQGGPQRNVDAEILDINNQPIPHLYGAGELGGINANQYQGGGNLAECLIFGKIAGENAAKPKEDTEVVADPVAGAAAIVGQNDLAQKTDLTDIKIEPNQYLGVSDAGIGGQVVARVTYANDKIKKVEIVQQSESADVGQAAVEKLPTEMVAKNTYDVDAISGASASSRAIKSAVKNAVAKAQNSVTN